LAVAGLMPDLTVVLDLPPASAAARMQRPLDRMEQQGDSFHLRVRQGFLDEVRQHPDKTRVIDANRGIDEIQVDLRAAVGRLLKRP
jgi:dTMP kinase